MMFNLHYAILIFVMTLSSEFIHCQPQSINDNELIISQHIPPGFDFYEYELCEESIKVLKYNMKQHVGQFFFDKELMYKKKLSEAQMFSVDSLISKLDLVRMDTSYANSVIDGVTWVYKFNWNGISKKINLDNYYLEEFDPLLNYLNSMLPLRKRFISFDLFETKSNYNNRKQQREH